MKQTVFSIAPRRRKFPKKSPSLVRFYAHLYEYSFSRRRLIATLQTSTPSFSKRYNQMQVNPCSKERGVEKGREKSSEKEAYVALPSVSALFSLLSSLFCLLPISLKTLDVWV
jgi:hypothetical protein